MAKLFISYRRKDSQWQSKAIYTKLAEHVGNPRENIFFDLDSMTLGYNFRDRINDAVAQCEYLLAMIGPRWLNETDEDSGERRLDNPNDFVRLEIAAALERGIPVIPVMLDGTPVPPASALPEDLKELALRHGVKVRADSFDADVYALIKGLNLVEEDTTDYAGEEWELITDSLQVEDYRGFARRNLKHSKALEAERRIRQLTEYAEIDQTDARAIADFRKLKGETDPLFEALKNQTKREMDRAARNALKRQHDEETEDGASPARWMPVLIGMGFVAALLSVLLIDPIGWRDSGTSLNSVSSLSEPIKATELEDDAASAKSTQSYREQMDANSDVKTVYLRPLSAQGSSIPELTLKFREVTRSEFITLGLDLDGWGLDSQSKLPRRGCRLYRIELCKFLSQEQMSKVNEKVDLPAVDSFVYQIGLDEMLVVTKSGVNLSKPSYLYAFVTNSEFDVLEHFSVDVSAAIDVSESTRDGVYISGVVKSLDGDLYISIARGRRCTASKRQLGIVVKLNPANDVVWQSPMRTSSSNLVLKGNSIFSSDGGSCEDDYIYELNASTGEIRSRQKLPSGASWIDVSDNIFGLRRYLDVLQIAEIK